MTTYYMVLEGAMVRRKFKIELATRFDSREDAIEFANASPESYVEVREYESEDDSEGTEILTVKN